MRLLILISILNLSLVAFGADCPTEKVSDNSQKEECTGGKNWYIIEEETDSSGGKRTKTQCLTPEQAKAKPGATSIVQ